MAKAEKKAPDKLPICVRIRAKLADPAFKKKCLR